ncbi:MAG: sigma 54-interacting transcriptional regulator, partial [Phycisphaerae bacterium]
MHAHRVAARRLLFVYPEGLSAQRLIGAVAPMGYSVCHQSDAAQAVRVAAQDPVHPIILIGDESTAGAGLGPGTLETVSALQRASSLSQIILLIPAEVDVDTCCRAIECGVSGFVELGPDLDCESLGRRLSEAEQRYRRQVAAAAEVHEVPDSDTTPFVSQSRRMAEVLAQAVRAAQVADAPVLILGESGTGKQLLAEMIHRLDQKRRQHPFLTVNCAAITGTLAESALFGHIKGAFTGATQTRAGYFRSADRGTLLLDEIGELDPGIQPKLLRALQEGLILPVGSDVEQRVDVRVLAATNQPLATLVEQGKFRLDLYQRLNVLPLDIPPLRERPEDIRALVPHFVRKYVRYYGREIRRIDDRVYEFLAGCGLEGNVRELENTVRRILALKTN